MALIQQEFQHDVQHEFQQEFRRQHVLQREGEVRRFHEASHRCLGLRWPRRRRQRYHRRLRLRCLPRLPTFSVRRVHLLRVLGASVPPLPLRIQDDR